MDDQEKLRCTVCHGTMVGVPLELVPKETVKQFAELTGHSAVNDTIGWYWCPECDFFGHSPSDEWLRKALSL